MSCRWQLTAGDSSIELFYGAPLSVAGTGRCSNLDGPAQKASAALEVEEAGTQLHDGGSPPASPTGHDAGRVAAGLDRPVHEPRGTAAPVEMADMRSGRNLTVWNVRFPTFVPPCPFGKAARASTFLAAGVGPGCARGLDAGTWFQRREVWATSGCSA